MQNTFGKDLREKTEVQHRWNWEVRKVLEIRNKKNVLLAFY